MEPALTTVRVDGVEMRRRAARCIIDRIGGDPVPPATTLPMEIVQRRTT